MQLSREFETAHVILNNMMVQLELETGDPIIGALLDNMQKSLYTMERHIDVTYPDSILAKSQSETTMLAFSKKISDKLKEISCIY